MLDLAAAWVDFSPTYILYDKGTTALVKMLRGTTKRLSFPLVSFLFALATIFFEEMTGERQKLPRCL